MGDAEDIYLLRARYEQALARYEVASSVLNRHVLNRTLANADELQRERDARAVLDSARRSYLEAWKRERDQP